MTNNKYSYPSEQIKAFALKHLNENPEQVNAHIESFRRWVKSMPHLSCPTDAKFLIMFLRVAKYDHAKAQKRLDNFCTIRSSERGHPEMFKFPDINDLMLEKIVRLGCAVPVGVTDDGEVLDVAIYERHDPKTVPIEQYLKVAFMIVEMQIAKCEEAQICGMRLFADLYNVGKNLREAWSDPKLMKKMMRILQDCYPLRMKGQVVYREPTWYTIILNIALFFLYEKHKQRIFRIKDDINKAFECIPGCEKILPSDFGGKGQSVDESIDELITDLKQHYKDGGPWKSVSVDESKRPKDTVNFLQNYADYDASKVDRGINGTFTKLNAL